MSSQTTEGGVSPDVPSSSQTPEAQVLIDSLLAIPSDRISSVPNDNLELPNTGAALNDSIPQESTDNQAVDQSSVHDPLLLESPSGRVASIRSDSVVTATLQTNITSKRLQSPYRLHWLKLLLVLATGAVLAVTIIYAWATSMTTGPLIRFIPSGYSDSLLVLRVLTEVSGNLLKVLYASTLDVVLWAKASSQQGITLRSLLGLSSTTGIRGLLKLLRWKNLEGGDYHHFIFLRYNSLFIMLIYDCYSLGSYRS